MGESGIEAEELGQVLAEAGTLFKHPAVGVTQVFVPEIPKWWEIMNCRTLGLTISTLCILMMRVDLNVALVYFALVALAGFSVVVPLLAEAPIMSAEPSTRAEYLLTPVLMV